MDLRASNAILEQLDGDLATLTGAATFQKIVVSVMQNAHRQLSLGAELRGGAGLDPLAEIRRDAVFPDLEEVPGWTIYLDDTTIIEKVATAAAKGLEGRAPQEQEQLRKAYQWWGIPTNKSKALERVQTAERLGALLDGQQGVLRTTTKRGLDLFSLGSWIRAEPRVAKKALQIYAGKAVHILQFRRCLFAVLQDLFTEIAKAEESHRLNRGVANEMLVLEALLPLVQFNLRAQVDGVVTASDACETGGGACYASRLSRLGEEELKPLLESGRTESLSGVPNFQPEAQRVIVFDLFAGIGGLEVALKKIGCQPILVIAVEKDRDCRRVLRRRFPGVELVGDIRDLGEEKIRKFGQGQRPHRNYCRWRIPLSGAVSIVSGPPSPHG